jgi:hypothetical protein
VIIFFISADALAGNQNLCAFHYKNYNIETLTLRLGDKTWTRDDMDLTKGDNKAAWAYFSSLYRGLSITNEDFAFDISEFRSIYSLFIFDVTPTGMGKPIGGSNFQKIN